MRLSKKNLLEIFIILSASLLFGLGRNFIFLETPLPLFRARVQPAPPSLVAYFNEADADLVLQMAADPGVALVDARLPEAFAMGHIPGAVNLPVSRFTSALLPLLPRLRAARLVIAYCGGPLCRDADDLAAGLFNAGIRDVMIYREGLKGWQQRGHAVTR